MDFKQLKTFLMIYETNGFSSAANVLGYAQSTVTTQIKLLEHELQVTLFNRIGKSISLTPEGKKLLPYAKHILQIERNIYNDISNSSEPDGQLVIGTPESLCNLLVPNIIKEFKNRYPKVNIEIKLATSNKLLKLIRDNEVDIAFTIGNKIEETDFISYPLSKEKIIFLVSPTHPLAQNKEITLEQISKYPLLLTSNNCDYRAALVSLAKQRGLNLNIALETSNVNTLKLFAVSGLGIAFLPYIAVMDSISSSELISLDFNEDAFDMTSEIIYHKDKHIFNTLKLFIDTTREIIQS